MTSVECVEVVGHWLAVNAEPQKHQVEYSCFGVGRGGR